MAVQAQTTQKCALCGVAEHPFVSIRWLEIEYGVSDDTWRRAIARNEIRAVKAGRQVRVDLGSVHEWLRVISDGAGL